MVERVIDFLAHQPTDTTSPLYLALNTAAMLAIEGVPDKVSIYDANAQEANVPYIKLYAQEQVNESGQFLGGSYPEWQNLIMECAAVGTTALQAQDRADALRLEVETLLKSLNFAVNTGALADRVSPSNSNNYDGIRAWQLVSNSPQTKVTGQKSKFVAVSKAQLRLLVIHGRAR